MQISSTRRGFLRGLIAVGAMLAVPVTLLAAMVRPQAAFKADSAAASIQALFGQDATEAADKINLKVPDIAENGAVVPVTVSTDLDGVESITVIIDNNPTPLSAVFNLTDALDAEVSTRVKMGKSSPVRAVVKAQGKVYYTSKEVKVTIGGCGG